MYPESLIQSGSSFSSEKSHRDKGIGTGSTCYFLQFMVDQLPLHTFGRAE